MADIEKDELGPKTPTRLQMLATVGKIVHYVSFGTPGGEYESTCRAAIVTEVDAEEGDLGTMILCVLNPTGLFFNRVPFDPAGAPGTWHWPERV